MRLVSSARSLSFCLSLLAVCLLTACNGNSGRTAPLGTPSLATATESATPSPTVTPTFTPSYTPTPTWVPQGPDHVLVPILLYHHVEPNPIQSPYRVSSAKFEEQLKLLHDWGYTTIRIEQLVEAINQGGQLPPRPVILSFDDGPEDVYTTAFPIMQKYGFTGLMYIVVNYMGTDGYMNADQIKEMVSAGWEVGSHSLNHLDLIKNPDRARAEVVGSRQILEQELGTPILTFAYPFGAVGSAAVDYVHAAGYIAAVGADGFTADQGKSNLFVLQRCEIKGSDDAKTFTRFLPWPGDPAFLPTDTPTPMP